MRRAGDLGALSGTEAKVEMMKIYHRFAFDQLVDGLGVCEFGRISTAC